jgi:hypothetical protein
MGRNSQTQKLIASDILLLTARRYIFIPYLVHLQAGLIKLCKGINIQTKELSFLHTEAELTSNRSDVLQKHLQ